MTARRPERAGIVLAGGRSSRFGRDKLAEVVRGRPMLEHAILAVAGVTDEVLVIGSAGPAALPEALAARIRRVPDQQPGAGPLAALETGLSGTRAATAVVVGGDMPDVVPGVLDRLATMLELDGAVVEAAVLVAGDRRQPLPAAVRVEPAREAARAALTAGELSLHALLSRIRVHEIPEEEWQPLDPERRTIRDIDRRADLVESP